MIEISLDRCTSCGRCVEVCPAGALSIREGHAVVDQALCRCCEACVSVCPEGALTSLAAPLAVAEPRLPQARPEAVIDVLPARMAPVPWHRRVLPVLADVVSFTGREVLPRVLEILASTPQERKPTQRTQSTLSEGQRAAGGQRSHHRYRGRHGRE